MSNLGLDCSRSVVEGTFCGVGSAGLFIISSSSCMLSPPPCSAAHVVFKDGSYFLDRTIKLCKEDDAHGVYMEEP